MTGGMTERLPSTRAAKRLLDDNLRGHAETAAELARLYARCLVRDALDAEDKASQDAEVRKHRSVWVADVTGFLAGKLAEHGEACPGAVQQAANMLGLGVSEEARAAYNLLPASAFRSVNGKFMKQWRATLLYPSWRVALEELA